ncbi:hypothetical protein [Nannocystis radixulma]|uniref:Uncharacterized protein n=1 Tax=Nannocystis radixulma TaxID=2995305 RepID=A0ABT5B3F3_9BACT|nr:hypothetical protein [Nannocystis radixulma]MDC0668003.1 hypothetical protein [Nannocystis radixulma]
MESPRTVALLDVPFRVLGPTPLAPYRLGAQLRAAGLAVRVHDLKPALVARIGRGAYRELSENDGTGKFGEWLFSTHASGDRGRDADDAFLDRFAADLGPLRVVGDPRRWLRRVRDEVVPEFLAEACASVEAAGVPAAVAFACESFQTNAALAVGRSLKRRHPQLKLVLGSTGLPAELGQPFCPAPWIDAVSRTGTDGLLAPLLQALVAGRPRCESGER